MSRSPLSGIRVIDLSQYAPGPYATKLLCDLGAEVIKIESPAGDPMRRLFARDEERVSDAYRMLNQGKTVARIDLKQVDAAKALMRLVEGADVLLESFRPGVMQRLGFSWPQCQTVNPRLVYASLSGYGQDGPAALKAGHDINYAAAAGMFSFTHNSKPVFPLVADHSGALTTVNSILAALLARSVNDQGSYLDVSLYETILSWQYIATHVMSGHKTDQLHLLTGGAACYNIYRTADQRFVTIGALEPGFWSNFCKAANRTQWIQRQFEDFPQRNLINEVTRLIASSTLAQWQQRLSDSDCCFEAVPLPTDVLHHPQTVERDLFHATRYAYPARHDGRKMQSASDLRQLEIGIPPQWSRTE